MELPGWRTGVVLALAVGGFFLSPACRREPEMPLRVGTVLWPPHEVFFLARELGHFPGRSVDLVEFRSPSDLARAYRNGTVDAAALTLDFAVELASRDRGQRVVLVIDWSHGGDAILARPEIETVGDLASRRVGVEMSTLGLYVLHRALETSELDLGDVTLVSVDYPELVEVYARDEVDAVVTFEPQRSRLLSMGAGEIFDSRSIPGEIADVLLVEERTLAMRRRNLEVLIDGWFEAVEFLRQNPDAAARQLAPRQHLAPEDLLAAFDRVVIPDRRANRSLLSTEDPALLRTVGRLEVVMTRLGLPDPSVDPRLLLEEALVKGGIP